MFTTVACVRIPLLFFDVLCCSRTLIYTVCRIESHPYLHCMLIFGCQKKTYVLMLHTTLIRLELLLKTLKALGYWPQWDAEAYAVVPHHDLPPSSCPTQLCAVSCKIEPCQDIMMLVLKPSKATCLQMMVTLQGRLEIIEKRHKVADDPDLQLERFSFQTMKQN